MNQKESNLNKNAITGIVALTKIITYISWIGLFIFLLLCLDDKLNMNLIPEKIDPIPLAFLIGISLSFGILIILPFTLDATKQQIKTLEKNKQSLTDYIYICEHHSSNRLFNSMCNHISNSRNNFVVY